MEGRGIILSLTDMGQALKKKRVLLYLAAFFFGCAAFSYQASKPIRFTAKGIFNGNVTQARSTLGKALEFLERDESSVSPADQRFLLHSTPVLEGVVKGLNLQATVSEGSQSGKFRELWYTLKTAWTYQRLRKHKTPSTVVTGNVLTPTRLIVPDQKHSLTCQQVAFDSETSLSLKAVFQDEKTFKLFAGKKTVGVGTLNTPFNLSFGLSSSKSEEFTEQILGFPGEANGQRPFASLESTRDARKVPEFEGEKPKTQVLSLPTGSFTLEGAGKKGKVAWIHFIPLQAAVESLKSALVITKNRENLSLIDISYTHRDRWLAAKIVNETMHQIQSYLTEQGKSKINKQLVYLQQRQNETMQQLDEMLQKQKLFLASDLDAGIIITLEKELEFMAQEQAEKNKELFLLSEEMQQLCYGLFGKAFEKSLIDETRTFQVSSCDSARDLIAEYQRELDLAGFNLKRYAYCTEKLNETDFDSTSLSQILNEAIFASHFEYMRKLHHSLADEKNWATKEKEQLKAALETEKRFLIEQIELLRQGSELHQKILQERIQDLNEDLLYLLYHSYLQTEEALNALKKQAAHLPQKWLNEQKVEIQTKLYTDMMESITKMVESKNIGYNIDYLMSNAFQLAAPPVLPDNPKLLLRLLIGAGGGTLIAFLAICLHQVYVGASASAHNLVAQGRWVLPEKQQIEKLGLKVSQRGKVVLLTSQQEMATPALLIQWLLKRGEAACLMEITSAEYDEADLASESFQMQLKTLKQQNDRVLIVSQNSLQAVSTEILLSYADTVVFGVSNEHLADLEPLPNDTLFVIQTEPTQLFSLNEMSPLLMKVFQRVKRPSFSSVKEALQQFSTKRP